MATRPDLAHDLQLARDATLEAGGIVMEYFRADPEVRFKAEEQPVTEADLRADALLRARLGGARPDYGWLSEETADSPERLPRRRVWIVDPIDGTNSFIEGRPEFVLSVALVDDGAPVVAVVYNPATGELYEAVRGGGARRNGRPIHVSAPAEPGRERVLASRSELRLGRYAAVEDGCVLVPLGSTAYRMLKVADGTGDLFVAPGSKNEWDVAGAALVVEEAGGRVRGLHGEELRYNQPSPLFRGMVASGGVAPARLRELLDAFRARP